MSTGQARPAWLLLAIASGACAAFNGVFAKLTTTELTTSWASAISSLLSLNPSNRVVEISIRALFFGLNLLFNAIMWGLFTRALTLASSTVRVSVINTSANFMITAVLGALIFSETLPGLWWLGAAMLVAGSVIIGRREAATAKEGDGTSAGEGLLQSDEGEGAGFRDQDENVELRSVKDGEDGNSSEDEDGVLR
ncbi:hypothetical protein M011DRAFT_408889 [Sporormia fimetaria CBS 119925]|uniref:EamA domain-containing protein n=1 Tax=Sporormia fimetaria CBS 119925 TaxID=1340428 RepID=A0A6A6V179_9PLEO|nr:hypothetical protein M011DRAFT_408889 [Sporormia fimetaria CBS 119925]